MIKKQKIPSLITFISLQAFSLLYVIIRFLTANLYGIFLLFLLLYFFGHHLGFVKAYSAKELIAWIINLPSEYRISIFTSIITVIGFMLAFQSGTSSLRKQLLAETNLKAADELWEFYKYLKRLVIKVSIFSKLVIDIFDLIKEEADYQDIQFKINYIYTQYDEFIEIRKKIAELSSEIFVYRDKYYLIVTRILIGQKYLDLANEAFSSVAEKVWVSLPPKNEGGIPVNIFIKHTKRDEFEELYSACQNADLIDMYIGYIKGYLLSEFIKPNIISIYTTIKDIEKFRKLKI